MFGWKTGNKIKYRLKTFKDKAKKSVGGMTAGSVKGVVVSVAATAIIGISSLIYLAYTSWYDVWRLAPQDGTYFSILVPKLTGDDDGSQTRHVIRSLESDFVRRPDGPPVMDVFVYPTPLKIDNGGRKGALAEAERRGRDWLKAENADLLIWGSVISKNKSLELRFLPLEGAGDCAKPYTLTKKALKLPKDFDADFRAVLIAIITSSIQPSHHGRNEPRAELIASVVRKLRPLAKHPPASFDKNTRAELWSAYAYGVGLLGWEEGGVLRRRAAVVYYRKVLNVWTRQNAPLRWAMTQHNLGEALSRNNSTKASVWLEEAVTAYREALKEYTLEKTPLQWACTQNKLGDTLLELGKRESGTAQLEEAVTAYRVLPTEWTRGHNEELGSIECRGCGNLGKALVALGERERRLGWLEKAIASFSSALLEISRNKRPSEWARAQTNIDLTLRQLGERQVEQGRGKGCAILADARQAMAGALEVRREALTSDDIELSERNLVGIDAFIARFKCGT